MYTLKNTLQLHPSSRVCVSIDTYPFCFRSLVSRGKEREKRRQNDNVKMCHMCFKSIEIDKVTFDLRWRRRRQRSTKQDTEHHQQNTCQFRFVLILDASMCVCVHFYLHPKFSFQLLVMSFIVFLSHIYRLEAITGRQLWFNSVWAGVCVCVYGISNIVTIKYVKFEIRIESNMVFLDVLADEIS